MSYGKGGEKTGIFPNSEYKTMTSGIWLMENRGTNSNAI